MSRPQPRMDTHGEVFGARIGAFIVDSILVGLIVAILSVLLVFTMPMGRGTGGGIAVIMLVLQLVILLLVFGYFIYFEGSSGQTPGKRLLGIVVVKEDGSDCDYAASAIRNILRVVDAFPTLYIVGLIVMYATDEHQRVGDIVANTVVVRTR